MRNSFDIHPYLLSLFALTALLSILYFGLRPKSWPLVNNVKWLSETKVLQFQNPSLAFAKDVHSVLKEQTSNEFTITIKISPDNIAESGFRPILMLHDGKDNQQLALWHWGPSIIVMNGDDYNNQKKWPRIVAKDVLAAGESCFISIVSNKSGTKLFINGKLESEKENLRLAIPNNGNVLHLILGNSIYGKHGWNGKIYGLSFYNKALIAKEIQILYERSKGEYHFPVSETHAPIIQYTFSDSKNNFFSDLSGNNLHLQLPTHVVVLKKLFLSLPGKRALNQSLVKDVTINLIGFLIAGAIIYQWLLQTFLIPENKAAFITISICCLLSLSVEILQAWLPARDSSMQDFILNTLGASAGVVMVNIYTKQPTT